MPQITSCPECSKKLRVPDDLIGKKVKCPGCTTMFIAEADEDADPAPPPVPAARKRSDAVTASPKRAPRPREDDEEEEERPRGRRDQDEEEEDRPSRRGKNGDQRVRSRRDDEEERRPRARRDEDDEDDRRSRSRRDEDDEEDDRRSRFRRRRDEDDDDDGEESSPREQVSGWQRVRMGINFVVLSGWIGLSIFGIYLIFGGVMLMMGGGSIGMFAGGNPMAGIGGARVMMVFMWIFMIFVGLLGLTSLALLMTGIGMTMAIPKSRRSSMRTLAISAFSCHAVFIALYLLGAVGSGISLNMAMIGVLMQFTGLLAWFVGHILWMVLLRSISLYFRDQELAGKVLTNLIVQIVYPFVAFLLLIIVGVFIGVSMAGSRTAGGAAASLGVGMILIIIMYGILILAWLGIYLWYILTLQRVRDLVEYEAARL